MTEEDLTKKTEEDIYDFSGVSYDLTSLRSELMQFREKGKPATTDRFRSEETLRNDISEKYNNYVLPSSSSIHSTIILYGQGDWLWETEVDKKNADLEYLGCIITTRVFFDWGYSCTYC